MTQVQIYNSFDALPALYDRLFSNQGAAASFFTPSWFNTLSQTVLDDNQRVRLYGVEPALTEEGPCLLLPMCHTRKAGFFTQRRLHGLANYYTCLFGPILSHTAVSPAEAIGQAVRVIAADVPRWDVVDLHPLDKESAVFGILLDTLRNAGMVVQPYFCFGNWYLDVNGRSFSSYFSSLPSTLRNTVLRKSRQLQKDGALELRILRLPAEVEEGIAAYERIYRASWKMPEPYPSFIPALIRCCAANGWLRLGVAYVKGEPAAAQIWIVQNRVASIYKLAYDSQYAKISIGSILTAHLMEYVMDEDKVREVDFLNGDEPYKRDWMSGRRERWGIAAFNKRTVKGVAAACWHVGGQSLKRLLNRPG